MILTLHVNSELVTFKGSNNHIKKPYQIIDMLHNNLVVIKI